MTERSPNYQADIVANQQDARWSTGTSAVPDATKKDTTVILSKTNERAGTLMASLKLLRKVNYATDFEIRMDGETLKVHRLVLAASSNYFKAMLGHNMKESIEGYAEIKGLDGKAVKACIEFLYSGEVHFDDTNGIESMLKASDLLQILDLKKYLFELQLNSLGSETCLSIRRHAVTYNSDTAVQSCDDYIGYNLAAVAQSQQWLWLSVADVLHCLSLSKHKDTATLWESVVKWVECNPSSRKEHLCGILRLITPLDFQILSSQILRNPLIEQSSNCVRFLLTTIINPNIDEFRKFITTNECLHLYDLAKRHQPGELKTAVLDFIAAHLPEISKSEGIYVLDYTDLSLLIKAASAGLSEEDKYSIISIWKKGNKSRNEEFVELFRSLDLTQVSPEFIHSTIRADETLSLRAECNNQIMDALYHHAQANRPKRIATDNCVSANPQANQTYFPNFTLGGNVFAANLQANQTYSPNVPHGGNVFAANPHDVLNQPYWPRQYNGKYF